MNIVYILYSKKLNRFYTGFTIDFETRWEFHKSALSNKYTAKANDWVVFLKIKCNSKKQGLAIERHIKNMKSKTYIKNLIKHPEIIEKLICRY